MALTQQQIDSARTIFGSGRGLEFFNTLSTDQLMVLMEAANQAGANAEQRQAIASLITEQRPIATRAATYTRGLPFIGSYTDELARAESERPSTAPTDRPDDFDPSGRLRGMVERVSEGGTLETDFGDRLNTLVDAFQTAKPIEATAGQFITGIVPEIYMGVALLPKRAATLAGTIWSGIKRLGAYSGAEGTIYGAGLGEGEERIQNALIGGAIGLGAGALGGGIAGGAMQTSFNRRFNNPEFARQLSNELNISEEASQMFIDTLGSGGAIDDAIRGIENLGERAMLANAGNATKSLLDATMQQGALSLGASEVANRSINTRARNSSASLVGTLDNVLGNPSIETTRRQMRTASNRTAQARQSAYEAVYNTPIDYSTNAGVKVLNAIRRIPQSYLDDALQLADDTMQVDGYESFQIANRFIGDRNGFIRQANDLNPVQLDYIARAIGQMSEEVDKIGKPTPRAINAKKLYGELIPALDDFLPTYNRARRLGLNNILEAKAIQLGERFFLPSVKRAEIEEILKQVTGPAREELLGSLRISVRNSIEEIIANTRRTMNDLSLIGADDAGNSLQEAKNLIRSLTSQASLDKLKLILPEPDVNRLINEFNESISVFGLQAATARNSLTAARQATGEFIGDIAKVNRPSNIREQMENVLMQQDKEVVMTALEDMASTLTRLRGKEARDALVTIKRIAKQRDISRKDAARIANLFWTSLFALDRGTTTGLSSVVGVRSE